MTSYASAESYFHGNIGDSGNAELIKFLNQFYHFQRQIMAYLIKKNRNEHHFRKNFMIYLFDDFLFEIRA